jgi:hypothetical protein
MLGALSVEGRGQLAAVALALSTAIAGISVEWRLELCAESIAPSKGCAQLHAVCILTMLILVVGEGAQAGGRNFGSSFSGPM